MFKIEWVNHASYIFDDGHIRLITDPWLEGSVFNESWSLLAPTKLRYEDFQDITHIWFSHEHPDHFFPPNLKKIPKDYRSNITVIFQTTSDRKVANFCKVLGFKDVVETEKETFILSEKSSIYIEPFSKYDSDSWHLIKCDNYKLLNVNDCVLNSKDSIKRIKDVTGEVDFLFTQFSYANWVGNPWEVEKRQAQAEEKLRRIENQIEILKPRYVVPFASFVYFSRPDNAFMNSTVNKIEKVLKRLETFGVEPLIFYPGDIYTGESWSLKNKENVRKYEYDFKKSTSCVSEHSLKSSSLGDIKNAFKEGPFSNFDFKSLHVRLFTRAVGTAKACIYLNDLNQFVSVDIEKKIIKQIESNKEFDIAMHSQCLMYMFRHEWGPGTILVAGTFTTNSSKGIKFINYMSESSHCIGQRETFSLGYVMLRLYNLVIQKLQRKIEDVLRRT